MFRSVKAVLAEMTELGGRDTEKGLFGHNGGYKTTISKNHAGSACPICGGLITRENDMGGSVYYRAICQAV